MYGPKSEGHRGLDVRTPEPFHPSERADLNKLESPATLCVLSGERNKVKHPAAQAGWGTSLKRSDISIQL